MIFDLTKAFLHSLLLINSNVLSFILIPKIGKLEIDFKRPKDPPDGSLSMTKLFLGPFVAQQDGGEAKEASR